MNADAAPLGAFALLAVAIGVAGFAVNTFYPILLLGVLAAVALAGWLFLRPVDDTRMAVVVGVLAGAGPAFVAGYMAWWWSDFCIFACEGVTRDPAAFVAWAVPVLAVFAGLGFLLNEAGQRRTGAPATTD